MDVQMPELDGLAATQAIRDKERSTGGHVPIVALTAHAMKDDRQRCLTAGMDAYVSKPLRSGELLKVLSELLAAHGEAASECKGTEATPCSSNFDRDLLLARVEGDEETMRAMAAAFIRQSGKLMAQITEAIQRQDGAALDRAAHALKGSIGNFGSGEAFHLARELEQRGRVGNLQELDAMAKRLAQQVQGLNAVLAEISEEKTACVC
jgi:DNA-binding response OmpR family regulator